MARITVALMRDLESQVINETISYSRMVEILNETALLEPNCKDFKYEYYHFYNNAGDDKYFKVNRANKLVWQVCVTSSRIKKGRVHCQGIYVLQYSSFLGTYYWHLGRTGPFSKMLITTENQYCKALSSVIKLF